MGMTTESGSPIIGVGGVVYRYTPHGTLEFLLIKKRYGFWTLPKGRVEQGETAIAALAREVGEETGISGRIEALVRELSYTISKRGQPYNKQVAYYLLHAQHGEPRPCPAELIDHVRWFPARAALRRIGRWRVRAVAREACRLLNVGQAGSAGDASHNSAHL